MKKQNPKKVWWFTSAWVICIISHSFCIELLPYFNIIGINIGIPRTGLCADVCKFALVEHYTRFGVGFGVLSGYFSSFPKIKIEKYRSIDYCDTSLRMLFPLEFYFVPFTKRIGGGRNFLVSSLYLYWMLCPWGEWVAISSQERLPENIPRNKASFSEIGIGISFGALLTLKLGHRIISAPSWTYSTLGTHYSFPGYNENVTYVGLDLYWGRWGSMGIWGESKIGNLFEKYPPKSFGFIPWIAEPIRKAKLERERLRPRIFSLKPEKVVPGPVVSISGENFKGDRIKGLSVYFDEIEADIDEVSSDRIEVRVPSGLKAGETMVKVKTNFGEDTVNFFVLPAKPPKLEISDLTFIDEDKDKILSAEESGRIVFTLKNSPGAGQAFGIEIKPELSEPVTDLIFPKVISVGDLNSGEQKKIEIPIKAGINLPTSKARFTIKSYELNGFHPEAVKIEFQTEKLKPPKIEIGKIEIDDGFYPGRPDKLCVGNGNGIIEPGESVEVVVTVVNKGTGFTRGSSVDFSCDDPEITFLTPYSGFVLGDLPPGGYKTITFTFSVSKRYTGAKQLPIKLVHKERRERFNIEHPLDLSLGKVYTKPTVVIVKPEPKEEKKPEIPTFGEELLRIPKTKMVNPDAVAVVIGVKDYKHPDVPPVEYALNDARLMKEYLIKMLGYWEENIIYLENPTQGDLLRVFGTKDNHKGQLFNWVKAGKSDVFIYYSGHGAPDIDTRAAYFVPSDCHPNFVKLGGYPLDLFYENLGKIPAKNITVVIDACFSGASERGMLIAQASGIMIVPVIKTVAPNMIVMTSSSGDEISSWYPEKRHGLFTYFFLKGLRGEADKNKDKLLTFAELRDYINENVPYLARRIHGRTQTPTFKGDKDRVVVKY